VILAASITSQAFADSGRPFVPFTGIRVLVLSVALFAPSLWLGASLIALAMVMPVAQMFVLWSEEARSRAPAIEPWQTVVFGLVSLGILVAQRRHARVLHELARVHSGQRGLARIAHIARSVRDLTNSPLQALGLNIALVRKRHPRHVGLAEKLDAAVTQLCRLNDALTPLDRIAEWKPIDLSFDALLRIDEQVQEAVREGVAENRHGLEAPAIARRLDAAGEARRALIQLSWVCAMGGTLGVAVYESVGFSPWAYIFLAGVGASGVGLLLAAPRLPRRICVALFANRVCCRARYELDCGRRRYPARGRATFRPLQRGEGLGSSRGAHRPGAVAQHGPHRARDAAADLAANGLERAGEGTDTAAGAVAHHRHQCRLNDALAPLDSIIQWRPGPGLDAITLLEREVREQVPL
jgi:hypothetical protein